MQEPLHLHGISHQISCRLLKQLETNRCEVPPRDVWWEQEVARHSEAGVCLFLWQSLGNSTLHLWSVQGWLQELSSAHCRCCTHWHSLCALWDNWVLLCLSEPQKSCKGIFNSSVCCCMDPSALHLPFALQLLPSLTPEAECHFHDKWILSAAGKDTSICFPVLPQQLGWAGHSPWHSVMSTGSTSPFQG